MEGGYEGQEMDEGEGEGEPEGEGLDMDGGESPDGQYLDE